MQPEVDDGTMARSNCPADAGAWGQSSVAMKARWELLTETDDGACIGGSDASLSELPLCHARDNRSAAQKAAGG